MMDSYTFVVVGGGIAGISCVEALQTWSPDETTLLVSETPSIKAAANAIQLTKTLVQFDVKEISIRHLKSTFSKLSVKIDKVCSIDSGNRIITMESGTQVGYKTLCLCLGGRPKIIEEGKSYVLGIRDTDSVNQLRDKLKNSRRIVIAGNGGIASELVYEIQGVEKYWVIKDQHISSVFLDPGAAEFLRESVNQPSDQKSKPILKRQKFSGDASSAALGPDWLAHNQLRGAHESNLFIESSTSIVEIHINPSDSNYPITVELDNGKRLEVDFVVSATGVTPSGNSVTVSPKNLNIAEDGGILIDENMRTNLEGVYAAGDVATAGWHPAKHWLQMRLWTQARQTGSHAGKVMAASLKNEIVYPDFCFEVFSHITKFFGRKVILLGLFNAQKLNRDCEFLIRVTKNQEYVKLVMVDGKIQGAVLIGETDLEEMCENLILDQLDVSSLGDQLLDPDIDIDDYFD